MGRVLTVTIKGKRSQEIRDGINRGRGEERCMCRRWDSLDDEMWTPAEEAWKLRAINLASVALESVPRGEQESSRNL